MRSAFAQSLGRASSHELINVCSEHARDPIQDGDRRVAFSALDTAEIGLMDLGQMREFLLREATLSPGVLQIQADTDPHIHEAMGASGTLASIDYES